MDQHDLEILSRFDAVWQRVQQGEHKEVPAAEHLLETVMDSLHYRREGCRQLAFCTRGTEKKRLLALSEQIKMQFRAMQLHYFLKEGDVYLSDTNPNFASYTPYNLRKLWQSTVENAEWMKNCNLKGDASFVADFQRMQEETEWQKNELADLIGRLLQ